LKNSTAWVALAGVRYALDVDAKRFGRYDPWWLAFGKMVWVRSNNHPINPWVSHLLFSSNSNAYARDFNVTGPK
jgi:hypothetical protein